MNPAHRTPVTVLLLLAVLCTACSRNEPATGAAIFHTPRTELPASPTEIAGTSRSAPPLAPRPATGPLLAPPETVLANYLSDTAPDGSPNPSTTGRAYHATFIAEQRDVAWADNLEPVLREYFERQRRDSMVVPFSVECRATMCEVLAVSRTPQSAAGEVARWQDIIYAMHREPWYQTAEIRAPEIDSGVIEDGRAAILIYLMRE